MNMQLFEVRFLKKVVRKVYDWNKVRIFAS